MLKRKRPRRVSDDIRIGACADYLLGKPLGEIEFKWGVTNKLVSRWISRTGSFKMRYNTKPKKELVNG